MAIEVKVPVLPESVSDATIANSIVSEVEVRQATQACNRARTGLADLGVRKIQTGQVGQRGERAKDAPW